MCYDFTISYVTRKQMVIGDTPLLAPVIQPIEKAHGLLQNTNFYVKSVIEKLSISEERLEDIQCHQEMDKVCHQVASYYQDGLIM